MAGAAVALPIEASYWFAGKAERVHVLSWTANGSPVAQWQDGSVSVVAPHRIRIALPKPARRRRGTAA